MLGLTKMLRVYREKDRWVNSYMMNVYLHRVNCINSYTLSSIHHCDYCKDGDKDCRSSHCNADVVSI